MHMYSVWNMLYIVIKTNLRFAVDLTVKLHFIMYSIDNVTDCYI